VRAGWAISTGVERKIEDVKNLKGGKMGVSRIGSGSYIMGFVLADQLGWLDEEASQPFEVVPLQTFDKLREGVNNETADFFMWEHFTSKRYYDLGVIKRIGEIYTPWSSWKIVASTGTVPEPKKDERIRDLFEKLDRGIQHFEMHKNEAVEYISTQLDYSKEDATVWLQTVAFPKSVKGVSEDVVNSTIDVLKKAGVLHGDMAAADMIAIKRT
jgi:hypothetical protein